MNFPIYRFACLHVFRFDRISEMRPTDLSEAELRTTQYMDAREREDHHIHYQKHSLAPPAGRKE